MKKTLFIVMTIALVLILSGCASSYKPINPMALNFDTKQESENIEFKYSYNVLQQAGNKKYTKKEVLNNIKIVGVKITNKTDKEISVSDDLEFYAGEKVINLVAPEKYVKTLNQSVGAHFFYLLLTPLKLVSSGSNGKVSELPIGFALGPGLTLINAATAGSANKGLSEELTTNNILGKTIAAGEELHGLIAIRDIGFQPLSVKLK
jgi:hypothetical protein